MKKATNGYRRFGKRLLDLSIVLFTLPLLLVLSAFIIVVSALVFRGRVFFLQKRLGYKNSVFVLYKFATLRAEVDGEKNLSIPERQSAWGKFLRDYSLDELPQFLNILRGEMSFVGPRPLLPEYRNVYTPEELLRHEVKPGLSGLAQVMGRNNLEWDEKMAFDLQYVQNLSFPMDLKILLKTLGVVLNGQSVNFGKSPERKKALSWAKNYL